MINQEPILVVKDLKQHFKINRNFTVKAVDGISFEKLFSKSLDSLAKALILGSIKLLVNVVATISACNFFLFIY